MCGIAGVVSVDPSETSLSRLKAMTDALAHRGPDGEGHWTGQEGRVGLGHRRLAVIDLSETGRQPMHYGEGRYTIVFNGEIYNYIELRDALRSRGYRFQSTSDTEVLLAMYDWKKAECLDFLDGMFAFAIYDAADRCLFCARDRFGEKPFYYTYQPGKSFCFGSEMKALWAGGQAKTVNQRMLFNYLAYGLVQNVNDREETFYEGISSLENSHYIWLDTTTLRLEKRKYWDLAINERGAPKGGAGALPSNILEEFRHRLSASVGRRLRADVSVGSSLSGGLDSSVIVCLAAPWLQERGKQMQTFSARFPGFARDEGAYMQMTVDQAKVDPVYVYPIGADLPDKVREILYYQEEPFGSASVLAQYDVMRAAGGQGVTVLLDGQGADEILGGYDRYIPVHIRNLLARNVRQGFGDAGNYLRGQTDNHVNFGLIRRLGNIICNDFPSLSRSFRKGRVGVNQLWAPLFSKSYFEEYKGVSYFPDGTFDWRLQGLDQSLYYDTCYDGLSELLRYADRNAMAHSREVRLPFLDHELVAFLFGLPEDYKIHQGWSKYLLRKAFEDVLPPAIAWRRDKVGYEAPQREWMAHQRVEEAVREAARLLEGQGIIDQGWLDRQKQNGQNAKKGAGNKNWQILLSAGLFG